VSDLPRPARSGNPYLARSGGAAPEGLADVLERVLDKGLVIAGDIQINLLDIELLTIKVRLLLASADTAQQMGIDWWKRDPFLSSEAADQEREALRERVELLERAVAATLPPAERGQVDEAQLTELRDRVGRGVDQGTAATIPPADPDGDGDEDDDGGSGGGSS
jgi:hypothetical protein